MQIDDVQFAALDTYKFIVMDAVENIFSGCLDLPVNKVRDQVIDVLAWACHDKVFHDAECRFTEGAEDTQSRRILDMVIKFWKRLFSEVRI